MVVITHTNATLLNITPVIIISPTTLYREALRALLTEQPSIMVEDTLETCTVLAKLSLRAETTVILLDLPQPDPYQIRQLKLSKPRHGILSLVQSYEIIDILRLLEAGATGCISRDTAPVNLACAISAVARGETVLPPDIAIQTLVSIARGKADVEHSTEAFSERESEVLSFIAQGFTNKEIAQRLMLSTRTIETHLHNIFSKLRVHSRTEAALWAIRHGYGSR